MFQSSPGQAGPAAPASSSGGGGEFTQFFNNQPGMSSGPGASFPMPPSTSTPVAPPKPKPGDDFEELFGGVNATPRPGPMQPPAGMPGGAGVGGGLTATSQFNAPMAPPAAVPGVGSGSGGLMPSPPPVGPAGSPPGGVAQAGVAPAAAVGAGSYTQMMQSPVAAQPLIGQQPAGGGKAPLPVQKKGIPTAVFVGVGIFALILIAGILYLVLSGGKK
jgi:hypothetical protein